MIVEFGHFTLILAFMVALVQTVLPLWGAYRRDARLMAVADPAAVIQFLLIAASFAALTYAFVTSDFSLKLVTANSHTDKPMLYKVAGVWGNHEGSLLLWVLALAGFGACAVWFGGNLPATLKARVLGVQGSIGLAFLAFMLLTSNPFLRLANPPMNGEDLNPLLQDPGLAFHPPFLYLGYVGLSMSFSFAIAALLEGRVDAAWGRWVRPWTLAAWIFLTIGIALGSWWAYYELGWGGFWFWDPVENASFMPWLIGAALLHSAIVVEKREPESLDDPFGDSGLWLQPDRHLHCALGRDYLGACFCQRPDAGRVHSDDPGLLHGRRADPVCVSRQCAGGARRVQPDQPRNRAGDQ